MMSDPAALRQDLCLLINTERLHCRPGNLRSSHLDGEELARGMTSRRSTRATPSGTLTSPRPRNPTGCSPPP